ncbi:MAG TPA: response regulator [Polyangia bacterium]|jgi:CheY-like chemotaxis protein|nr:response regulator [Polyangia bacterium]
MTVIADPRFIFLVEDDADIRDSVVEALEDEGYRVTAAANGLEALERLQNEDLHPDLILLDVMMPVMDGWGFRAEQQKIPALASTPVLVFSAYNLPNDAVAQLNAAGILKKPFSFNDLLDTLERLLGAREQVR